MHFYDFNIGEYAKKTQHLTNEEDLAYRRLLDMYYDTEKPIANPSLSGGLATLSRRLRVSEQAIKNVLDEFFPDGVNKHAEEKITAYYAYIAKQTANGKIGGRPKRTQAKPTVKPKKPSAKPTLTTNHLPLPTNQEPLTTNQEDSKTKQSQNLSAAIATVAKPATAKEETELQIACRSTWKAYSDAYFSRYETEPVRNATVNTQVKSFVKRIGADESPHVAAFFLQSNSQFYVQRGHTFGNLLADAEKLRTEWATGRTMTGTRARQIDATQANYSVVGEALKILEAQHAKTT